MSQGPGEPDDDARPRGLAELAAVWERTPVLVAYLDTELRCRFVNPRLRDWFGLSKETALGRPLRELVGEAVYERVRGHVDAALSGRAVSFEEEWTPPGAWPRRFAVSLAPDAGRGTVAGLAVTVVDVTQHVATEVLERQARDLARSQETVRDREARLRAILESAVDGIIAIDESGAIQSLNPAAERLFGYSEREILGHNVNLLMPSPYRDEHDGYLAAYLRTSQAKIIGFGREVQARRKNGEVFPIHLSVGEARLGSRRIFTGIIHDLTTRNRLQEQLAQSQKMEAVGRLAGGVAHDFNNVLQTVLARCDAMRRRLPARSALRDQVREIQKAGRRAAALTRQLLAVSRTQLLNARVVDLNVVLRDTADMLRRSLGEDVALAMDLEPDLAPVKVDPDQIVQVVLNLVVNARDAMPRGGRLRVQTRNATPEDAPASGHAGVVLSVRDTGAGMDEPTRARIFEPYFTTKGDKGTGLGLSTVYGIVEQSGGSIRVESRLGEGSTFHIHLPRAEGRPVEEVVAAPRPAQRRRGARLLLVEDELAARRALEELLRDEGHTVLSAGNGLDAERIWRQTRDRIDVVITDTVMPRMSGPELVERLRASHPDVRVIFMSGHTPETVLRHGGADVGTAFLQKPFEVDELLARVRDALTGGAPRKRRGP